MPRTLIVGAGLAGLSAAIAIARRGGAVTIATLDDRAEGTSITITNRAVDAIEELGVLTACLAAGDYPTGPDSIFASMMDAAGHPIPVPPPPPRPDTRLPPFIAIYRPDLTRLLVDAAMAAGVTMRTGLTFSGLADHGDRVDVHFADGKRDCFDLVIGADGTHSAVRRVIHPAVSPTYTGWMSFRLLLEDGPDGPAGFYSLPAGQGLLATVRLPGNRLYLAAGMEMANRRVSQAEAVDRLDVILARYSAPLIRAIRDRLRGNPPIVARPFETVLVPSPWHRGRITVIGDAAHSTTPNLASGGSIALEDGVVLGEELAKGESVATALDAFMARRYARCAMVVETSLAIGRAADGNASPERSAALRSAALAELIKPY